MENGRLGLRASIRNETEAVTRRGEEEEEEEEEEETKMEWVVAERIPAFRTRDFPDLLPLPE